MQIGDFELHLLVATRWRIDGGMLFGVVPRVLWEKKKVPDELNMVPMACVGAVIRHRGKVVVCETGIGTKLSEPLARRAQVREPEGLLHGLRRLGIRPAEVDLVLTTHLHWDHAGGLTRRGPDGELELTFPNAKHFVQRLEWEFALSPDPRSRAGYIEDDFLPVAERGRLELLDGDAEIMPGIELRATGGHTPGHQMPIFRSGDWACVMPGDLIPTRPHLRLPWTMSADLDTLRLLEEKARLLEEAGNHRWLLIMGHEVEAPAGYLESEGAFVPEPEVQIV